MRDEGGQKMNHREIGDEIGRLQLKFAVLHFLFFISLILAPFGVYVNVYFLRAATLPVNISIIEYLVLTLAMLGVIPFYISRKRTLAKYKRLKSNLSSNH
jgi:uncharacterized membrane protein